MRRSTKRDRWLDRIGAVERDADGLEAMGFTPQDVAPIRESAANARRLVDLMLPPPKPKPTHGTLRSFRNGCRCGVCVARCPHGPGGYTNWRCRCEICKAAGSAANRANVLRRNPGAASRRAVAACGTYSGYYRHRRRHEAACEPCREALRVHFRERRARASAG